MRSFGGKSLILFLGASGSGKSSFVRAGIIPRLKQKHRESWLVVKPFRCNDGLADPWEKFSNCLSSSFQEIGVSRDRGEIKEFLQTDQTPHPLLRVVHELEVSANKPKEATVLMILDQFEEMLGKGSNSADGFLNWLGDALLTAQQLEDQVFRRCRLMVLIILRSDFLPEFQRCEALAKVKSVSFQVKPIPKENFGRLIEGPANKVGLVLEPDLIRKILEDAETDNILPMLAYTLSELWKKYGQNGNLTLADYNELGGLKEVITKRVNEVWTSLNLTLEKEEDVRRALLAMVDVSQTSGMSREVKYTRKRLSREELSAGAIPVLKSLLMLDC